MPTGHLQFILWWATQLSITPRWRAQQQISPTGIAIMESIAYVLCHWIKPTVMYNLHICFLQISSKISAFWCTSQQLTWVLRIERPAINMRLSRKRGSHRRVPPKSTRRCRRSGRVVSGNLPGHCAILGTRSWPRSSWKAGAKKEPRRRLKQK